MAVYCDLEMETETALELLKFLELHRASTLLLTSLFDEIERQVTDSLEYEARFVPGTLRKSERH
jgi:hypothetical protein